MIHLHVLFCALFLGPTAPDTSSVVWPPPPARPRVRHVATLGGPEDYKVERSALDRLAGLLFGEEPVVRWLVQPVGIAVSPAGMLAVADPGARGVHMLHPDQRRYAFLGESSEGPLRSPVGVAYAPDGTLYVTDTETGTVAVFDEEGDPERVLPGTFRRPTGIAATQETLFVVETDGHDLAICSREGKIHARWGGRGTEGGLFNYPVHVAAGSGVFVVDALNHRVQHLSTSGGHVASVGSLGTGRGTFAAPKAAALDSEGHLYVTDALKDNLQVFDSSGTLLLVVGTPGTAAGQFQSPSGIAIDARDRIYVVDALNRRIQIFQYLR
jgi:DNA-binding beta-propeller fold protein YncE